MPEGNELQVNPTLTNVSMQYKPKGLIGDQVIPDYPVTKKQGDFKTYKKEDGFTIPDTRVGPKSEPNEVDYATGEDTYSCKDEGLDDFVSVDEEAQAVGGPFNALVDATEFVTGLYELAKEKKKADIIFNPATYPVGNKLLLAGATQWSDPLSDPIADHEAAKLVVWGDPNSLVYGVETWSALRRHPDIIKSVTALGSLLDHVGLATLRGVAELFEVEQVFIGRARYNTAKKGQPASYSRLWGKHAALLDISRPSLRGLFFAANFLWTPANGAPARVVGTIDQPQRGLRGGRKVRVGESYVSKVAAPDTGYFFEDAVA